tara:strand:- start:11464 stop:11820 length:357 start_codon:yes stop_codon:yes gene_type:complete
MALVKFEIENYHLILLKHLDWEIIKDSVKISSIIEEGSESPFGGLSVTEDVGVMLFGKPEGTFDPLSAYGPQYTDEQKMVIARVWGELPKALEICCYIQKFEAGVYATKWNLKHWRKI